METKERYCNHGIDGKCIFAEVGVMIIFLKFENALIFKCIFKM